MNIVTHNLLESLAATHKPKEPAKTHAAATNGSARSVGFVPMEARVEQARRYMAQVPGAVSGEAGHQATIKVAGHLARGFDLPKEYGMPVFREWSERSCQPPWPESDLEHKYDDALAYPGERGFHLREPYQPRQASPNGHRSGNGHAAAKPSPAQESQPVKFSRISSRELATGKYEIVYLVEDILADGQPCIMAGAKKVLKTTLLIALAVALARGVHFLGRFRVPTARRVLVMSGESGVAVLQETARRICKWHECDLADLDNLIWSVDLPQIAAFDHLDALEEMLRADEVEVLIVDPAYLCLPCDDVANLFAMGKLLGNLTRICQANGVTLVLVHHTKKGVVDPFEAPELENIAFAGFQEFARQWVLVGRRERYAPGSGSHALWLNVGGSAGHSGLWALDVEEGSNTAAQGRTFDAVVTSAEKARNEARKRADESKEATQRDRDTGNRNKILRALYRHPEGGTRSKVREWVGLNSDNGNRAIEQLLEAGSLIECEVRVSNHRKAYAGVNLASHERDRLEKLAVMEQIPHGEVQDDFGGGHRYTGD